MEQGYIYIHNCVFPSLLAISAEEQARGLMYVDPPAPVMSFIYHRPQINKFWMANTKCPLDIVFCYQGIVSQLHVGEPYSTRVIGDDTNSDLIMEFPNGTIDSNGIKIGYKAGIVLPSPEELRKIIAKKSYQFTKF